MSGGETKDLEHFAQKLAKLLSVPDNLSLEDETLNSIKQWDSLAMLEFTVLADEHYGVLVTSDQLRNCKTVADLFRLVSQKA